MVISEQFPETSWTLLEKAREQTQEGLRAREEFAKRYYRPVQQFLLALVRNPGQAQDLAQVFFVKVSGAGGILAHAEPDKGAFHDYVKQALRNLVADHYRSQRQESQQIYPDQASEGGWDVIELRGLPAAEAAFHHEWVKVTLAEALSRVQALCIKRNQHVHLDLFQARYLGEAERAPSWEELGARYGMDQKAARERADTVARHFRQVLRRMLRNEIMEIGSNGRERIQVGEAAIDDAIKALLSPLRD